MFSGQQDKTHPPASLLKALLHSDCTGKVPVDSLICADGSLPFDCEPHITTYIFGAGSTPMPP
jgi:hypothetical protein